MPEHPLHSPVLSWYRLHRRELPWRAPDRTAWGVLVSEVMLQQTPVVRVLPAWHAWLARWPDPAALAADAPGEAIRMWDRLGYPRRALRLHDAAAAIVQRHGGQVPAGHDELLALPGVGPYTAAAVASFAFGRRHPVLDTNVRRVLARTVGGEQFPGAALTVAERARAAALVPDDPPEAAEWAVAVMELGALICTARSPRCDGCPVAARCRWTRSGRPEYDGPPRRGQTYAGTDRYLRGLLLAALRDAPGPLPKADLILATPDHVLRDPLQRDRCLGTLLDDGLLEPVGDELYALPAGPPSG